jgi:putative copper export protein
MHPEPLITWPEPIIQLIGFIGSFLACGAVGFRFAAVRGHFAAAPDAAERAVYLRAIRRAGIIGLIGAVISLLMFFHDLPGLAARTHVTSAQAIHGTTLALLVMLACQIIGFAIASGHVFIGWLLAALGVFGAALRGIFFGPISRLVNPVHVLVAGLWIGTLFVVVVAGLVSVLRDEPVRARRGAIVADLVNGFSPLALTCGGLVVLSGLTTAWTHLKKLDALWTTPYGYTLMVKLCVVAFVFGLGAWNWRRVRPSLGSEEAAISIRRSSTRELTAASIVLMITAILVSLPNPK